MGKDATAGMRGGAVKLLAKPFDGEILIEAVQVAMKS
jgi:FixJ family two-component response regulator